MFRNSVNGLFMCFFCVDVNVRLNFAAAVHVTEAVADSDA